MNTQIFKDIVDNFNVLSKITDSDDTYFFQEVINGEHYFRIKSEHIYKRYEFCIARKKNKSLSFENSFVNLFNFDDHGYPTLKCLIDFDSNIIRITTRVKPDLMEKEEGYFKKWKKTIMKIPYDIIEKYKKAGVEPKEVRLYSWGSNYYCFIEHNFKISKKNIERVQKIINIFPEAIERKRSERQV